MKSKYALHLCIFVLLCRIFNVFVATDWDLEFCFITLHVYFHYAVIKGLKNIFLKWVGYWIASICNLWWSISSFFFFFPLRYSSFAAFLLNHASPDHFQPYSIRDVHIMLAEQFRGAKFCINGGISLFKSGVVPVGKGFPLRKGAKSNENIDPADVSFHLLPTNQNATDNFSVYTAGKPENLGNCIR